MKQNKYEQLKLFNLKINVKEKEQKDIKRIKKELKIKYNWYKQLALPFNKHKGDF
tara:strand:- start:2544 stop:2708 length:165 start_codon:yes stop_codon:yes gene_type:complete